MIGSLPQVKQMFSKLYDITMHEVGLSFSLILNSYTHCWTKGLYSE